MFLSFVGVAAQRTVDARGSRDVVVVVLKLLFVSRRETSADDPTSFMSFNQN
jgi:hypothetical protein